MRILDMLMTSFLIMACVCPSFTSSNAWTTGPSTPLSANIAAIHRSVKCGDENSMLLKVIYDPDRLLSDNGDEQSRKLPVVLFLSGADCPHESYMWLASRLALEGCCVMLSSCVVPFGPTTCLLSTPFNMSMLTSLDEYKKGPSSQGIAALLDEVKSLGEEQDCPLCGRLDFSRLVVGGHSSGGRTALDLVAFDNPFDISAVFTYGASLVNSGLPFVEKGSILPCEATRLCPPPLLLMGGSHDGVSAQLSPTKKDATETLRRTMDEALVHANGDVDLLVLKGANHLSFCEPADPTCGAAAFDWPLGDACKSDGGAQVRHVLGEAICDFLRSRGVFSNATATTTKTTTTTTTTTTKTTTTTAATTTSSTIAVDDNGAINSDPIIQFSTQIPAFLRHTAESFRAKTRTRSPIIVERGDDDTGRQDQAVEAWELLSSTLEDLISNIVTTLGLESNAHHLPMDARQWTAGNLTGNLKGWRDQNATNDDSSSTPSHAVEWAVRYATTHNKDTFPRSLGFNIWLSPRSDAPHLTVYIGVRGNRATLMADHLPRRDLAHQIEYARQHYGGTRASVWSNLRQRPGVRPFASMDPSVRAVQGPNALALMANVDNDDGISTLVEALNHHCSTWLEFVQKAPLLEEEIDQESIRRRDDAIRTILRNHERAAGEQIMDADFASFLADCMAGMHNV